MAISAVSRYPTRVEPATPEYPFGGAKNAAIPRDGTGTPWEKDLLNDIFGPQQALLSGAGITPSGTPDTATESQYLQALKSLMGSTLASVSEMREATNVRAGDLVTLLDYEAGNNAGVLFFRAEALDATPEDGGSCIKSNGTPAVQFKQNFPARLTVKMFGAVGNGVFDNHPSFTAAIAYLDRGKMHVPAGSYLTSAEIVLDKEGIELCGDGVGSLYDNINGYGTRIFGTTGAGAVIRIKLESCCLRDMVIDAEGDRLTAAIDLSAATFNAGVRVEADDVAAPEGDVFSTCVERVHIINQPNDGLVIVGRCYESTLRTVVCEENKGHGMVITNGTHTGRTNIDIAGAVTIDDCAWKDNEGHGYKIGEATDDDYAFRVVIRNSEGRRNCGDAGLLEAPADSFAHCDGLTIINGAATGLDKPGTGNNAGLALMGAGGTLIDHRILSTTTPILMLNRGTRTTMGWDISNPHIRTTASAHVINLETGIINIKAWIGDTTGALTEAVSNNTIDGLDTYVNGVRRVNADVYDKSGLRITAEKLNNLVITSTPLTILDASQAGKMWTINGRHTSDPGLSAFSCKIIGGSVPAVFGLSNISGSFEYSVTFSGTDAQLSVPAGTRNSDIFIREEVVS